MTRADPPPIGPDSTPAISPVFRLQFEPAQDAWVLLFPEGMLKLNQSAAEILRRCDGRQPVSAITADLERAFEQQGLLDDVLAFLAMARKERWITVTDPGASGG
ncbi:MAG: pyrroloquinoline quinone biosynthesis peptide chaperone PqqD [Burkholderiaceae bacterium]